jgi:peptidoglycan/xylan/chitin deacetylase (PgdA/CDA1 family)
VALTFDDGYADVYRHAFPLLSRKGIPFAVFVVTGLVGTDRLHLHDRLYLALARAERSGARARARVLQALAAAGQSGAAAALTGEPAHDTPLLLGALRRRQVVTLCRALDHGEPAGDPAYRCMSWDMLGELVRAGVTVGCHTSSHALLPNEAGSVVRRELATAKRALERRLATSVDHFAYPAGAFNARVVDAVERAGFRNAFTICNHRDPRRPALTVPRTVFWERTALDDRGRFSDAMMSCHVHRVFPLRAAGCAHRAEG